MQDETLAHDVHGERMKRDGVSGVGGLAVVFGGYQFGRVPHLDLAAMGYIMLCQPACLVVGR